MTCEHCGASFKVGILSANQPLSRAQTNLISLGMSEQRDAACNRCGDEDLKRAKVALDEELQSGLKELQSLLSIVPILSLQHPMGWRYEPLTIITAQSVAGTGLLTDVSSTFSDLFGWQSGSYNSKIRDGEHLCKKALRVQALEQGGNAVIGVDVDYAEVGAAKAMVMVCMTGTAIKVLETDQEDIAFQRETARGHRLVNKIHSIRSAFGALGAP